jgi:tetratricopeptide (TPR) repeat protein
MLKSLCLTVALLATSSAWAVGVTTTNAGEPGNDGKFRAAVRAVEAKQFESAIPMLEEVLTRFPRSADTNNYLGYANRKIGKRDIALAFYQKALSINPEHRGAHEYLGELYAEMRDLPKAQEQLAMLQQICGSCEEADDLKRAIASAR